MGSRIRQNPEHIFICFCEVVIPSGTETEAWILQKYPDDFGEEELLKSVTEFSCPCEFKNDAVQHFSFVLTSLDSKWTYGYCRQAPNQPTLFCLLSFLPWHETFYKLLNQIADLTNDSQAQCNSLSLFLEKVYNAPVPEPNSELNITFNLKVFRAHCPNHLKLPSIPENRNLTEYFNAIDAHNMMVIFASMLHERRIIIISRKLGRLSACVQAANMLLYPMHWQHIFIPVLPKHLLDYLNAPMPFLIGSPSSILLKVELSELGDVVILDADNNKVRSPFDDFETLPPEIISSLKRRLKNPNAMLGDGVARAFMRALVHLIGGYRDALKIDIGKKISFDSEAFIRTRPSSMRPFLETMLHLQVFQQFIEDRLEMLNSGIGFSDDFEAEVSFYEVNKSTRLKTQYKEWVSTMKKEGGMFLKNVKSKTNPAVKSAVKSVKERSRRAYKDIRSKLNEMQKHPSQPNLVYRSSDYKTNSAPSSPSLPQRDPLKNSRLSYTVDYGSNKQGFLGEVDLRNSMSVTGIRKYKMLTVDEISVASEDSLSDVDEIAVANSTDMDLMSDLQDIIFRKCSISNDDWNKGEENLLDDSDSKEGNEPVKFQLGFDDSFCEEVFLPAPIPPPRAKRKQMPQFNEKGTKTEERSSHLIKLDSVDDEIFDPLEMEGTRTGASVFYSPLESTKDKSVNELKEKIQKLQCLPNVNQPPVFNSVIPSTGYPRVLRTAPEPVNRMNIPPNLSLQPSLNYNSTAAVTATASATEFKPPIPPKTGFGLLSQKDRDLLNDYGLGTAPIFTNSIVSGLSASPFSSSSSEAVASSAFSNTTNMLLQQKNLPNNVSGFQPKKSPGGENDNSKATWQKFV